MKCFINGRFRLNDSLGTASTQRIKSLQVIIALACLSFSTFAQVSVNIGQRLDSIQLFEEVHEGKYRVTAVGGSMRTSDNGFSPCELTTGPVSKNVANVPANAQIAAAYLYWGTTINGIEFEEVYDAATPAQQANPLSLIPEYDASMGIPNGVPNSNDVLFRDNAVKFNGFDIQATREFISWRDPGDVVDEAEVFYTGWADVTNYIDQDINGEYTVDELVGFNEGYICDRIAVYSGWQLYIIYRDADLEFHRRIQLYDGLIFTKYNEQDFTLRNVDVPMSGVGAGFIGTWEGDGHLNGNEVFEVEGTQLASDLYDSESTVNLGSQSSTFGVDVDRVDIPTAIIAGKSQIDITVTSGQDLVVTQAVLLIIESYLNELTEVVLEDNILEICLPPNPLSEGVDPVSVIIPPSNGTISGLADGDSCVTYMPDTNYNGPDSVVLYACTSNNACDTVSIDITVIPVNDPPIINDDFASICVDENMVFDVLDNDQSLIDGDINPSSLTIVNGPSNGSAQIINGEISYTPTQGFVGIDTVTYNVCDDGDPQPFLCDDGLLIIDVEDSEEKDLIAEICEGMTFTIGGSSFENAGNYTITLSNQNGCDSIINLTLIVNPLDTTLLSESICDGESFQVGGQSFESQGIYTVGLTSTAGCDSTIILALTVRDTYNETQNVSICDGQSYTVDGQTFTSEGTYTINSTASNGCDSTITLNLTVNDTYDIDLTEEICDGESFTVGNQTFDATGNYSVNLTSVDGCDSMVNLALTVKPTYDEDQVVSICTGSSYTVGGQTFNTTGIYTINLTASNGCDSTITLDLEVKDRFEVTLDEEICEGESFIVGNQTFDATGSYVVNLVASNGCDSVVTLNLDVNPVYNLIQNLVICQGESVTVGGQTFDATGNYIVNLTTTNGGCDSIIDVDLTVNPTYDLIQNESICDGESVVVGGQTFNSEGTYTINLNTVNSCDSIITLNLEVRDTYDEEQNVTICQGSSYTVGGQTFTTEGTYTINLTASNSCDSTITLNLEVNDRFEVELNEEICDGESFTVGGNDYSTTGTFVENLLAVNGCDSVVTLNLTVNPVYNINRTEIICQGESIVIGGQTFDATGTFTINLSTASSCDSIINLDLTVNPTYDLVQNESICDGENVVVGGQTFDTEGTYTINLSTVNSCDSTVTLNLEVRDTYDEVQNVTICQGSSYTVGGQTFTSAGTYTIDLTASNGCDSTITLNLNVEDRFEVELNEEICDGESFTVGGNDYTTTGTFVENLSAVNGCDSVVTLNLTVNPTYSIDLDETICQGESFEVGNQTFTDEGNYLVNLQTVDGCDSIVNLALTVNPSYDVNLTEEICEGESFTIDGQDFTTTGNYTVSLTTALGCDSTINLNLTVLNCVDLFVLKTVEDENNDQIAIPGELLTYTIEVTNSGVSTATDVVITDELPEHTSLVAINNGGTENNGVITWNIPAIVSSGSVSVSFVVITDNPYPGGVTQVSNLAYADSVASCDDPITCDSTVIETGREPIDTIPFAIFTNDQVTICDTDLENNIEVGVSSQLCDLQTVSQYGSWEVGDQGCLVYTSSFFEGTNVDTICLVTLGANGQIDTTIFIATIMEIPIDPCDPLAQDSISCTELTDGNSLCIPIRPMDLNNYEIEIDGIPYAGGITGCDADTLGGYDFSTALIQRAFRGVNHLFMSWEVDGTTVSINQTVSNFQEIADVMNSIDPVGEWFVIEDRVESLTFNNMYGPATFFSPASGAISEVAFNFDLFANGSSLDIPDGCHWVSLVDSLDPGCADSFYVCAGIPDAVIEGADSTCLGNAVTLTASGGNTFEWSTGETTASISVNPNATTTYSVTVTYGDDDCQDGTSHTVTVSGNPTLSVDVSQDVICVGESATLTANVEDGVTVLWSTGETTETITVSPSDSEVYTVTATNSDGCETEETVSITVNQLPQITIDASDNNVCEGEDVHLDATAPTAISFEWSTGDNSPSITVNPVTTTTYTVTVTDANGCQNSSSVTIVVNEIDVDIQASATEVCESDVVTLTTISPQAVSYEWSTGETTESISVNPTTSTTYEVTVTDANGCEESASVTINVNEVTLSIDASASTVCEQEDVTLTGVSPEAISFEWSTGETTETIVVNPVTTTTYDLTVTDINGCTETASVIINVNEIDLSITASETEVCELTPVTLTAVSPQAVSFEWSTGEATESIVVDPATTTTYGVTVTDVNGCEETASITIEVNEISISIDASATFICEEEEVTLTAVSAEAQSFEWSTGETTPSIIVLPVDDATYTVTVTDGNGCSATESVDVVVNVINVAASASATEICAGEEVTLTALASGNADIMWSTGESSQSITVSPGSTTIYTVTATGPNGCTDEAMIAITVDEFAITIEAEDGSDVCEGSEKTLTVVGDDIESIEWSTDETTESIAVTPTATTTYTVTATNTNGCSATTQIELTVEELGGAVIVPSEPTFCLGEEITLSVDGNMVEGYIWSTGDITGSITVNPTETTDYGVTILYINGCQEDLATTVTVDVCIDPEVDTVYVDIIDDSSEYEICLGDEIDPLLDIHEGGICDAGNVEDVSISGENSECVDIVIDPNTLGHGDTICVYHCDTIQGICDTTIIILIPEDPITDTVVVTIPTDSTEFEICLEEEIDLIGPITSTSVCDPGETESIDFTNGDTCVVINYPEDTGFGSEDTVCIVQCSDDICDTTIIVFIPDVMIDPDTIFVEILHDSTEYEICLEDEIDPSLDIHEGGICDAGNVEDVSINGENNECVDIVIDPNTLGHGDTICVYHCDTVQGICDTTIIILIPEDPITDTVVVTIPTDSTEFEICLEEEIDLIGPITSTSVCDPGETESIDFMNGDTCVVINYPEDTGFGSEDTVCIVHCSNDICDTTIIVFIPDVMIDPDTIFVEILDDSTEYEICLEDEIDPSLDIHEGGICDAGNVEDVSINEDNNECVDIVIDPNTLGHGDTICVYHCDTVQGICDTTIIVLIPEDPITDTVVVTVPTDSTEFEICLEEEIDLIGPITSTSVCGPGETESIDFTNGDTCVVINYPEDTGFGSEDTVCIVHCSDDICDTTIIVFIPDVMIDPDTIFVEILDDSTEYEICLENEIDPSLDIHDSGICDAGNVEDVSINEGNNECVDIVIDPSTFGNGDTLCVYHCDTLLGICDTTIIVLFPEDPVTDTVITFIPDDTNVVVICLDEEIDLIGPIDTAIVCDMGEAIDIEFTEDTCVVITFSEGGLSGDQDSICILHCSEDICDTTIIIIEPGNPPVAVDDDTVGVIGTPIVINVLNNDYDPDGDSIVIVDITTDPSTGTVEVDQESGVITYTPGDDFVAIDSFQYVICDVDADGDNPKHGCDTAWVFIRSIDCVIPEVITPNNDGLNDFFVIECAEFYDAVIEFCVYNRWGNQVYRSEAYQNDWDGYYDNEPLPDGTYYYSIKFDDLDGNNIHQAGFVVIHR